LISHEYVPCPLSKAYTIATIPRLAVTLLDAGILESSKRNPSGMKPLEIESVPAE
jgi:hypothetical protein